MPTVVARSAIVMHSAIVTESGAIGFVASALVLAVFVMKDMVSLRIVGICSVHHVCGLFEFAAHIDTARHSLATEWLAVGAGAAE
jgi:hypothetical protein